MPHQGTRFFKRFTFGDLGDLSILETRQNRSQQVSVPDVPFDGFVPIGVNPAIDGAIASPARHLPEPEQLTWLKDGVAAAGPHVAPARQPGHDRAGRCYPGRPSAPRGHLRQRRPVGRLHRRPGEPPRPRSPPSRRRPVTSSCSPVTSTPRSRATSPCTTTPGSASYTSAGVEFVCPSVTSDGFFEVLGGTAQLAGQPPEVVVAVTRQAIGAAQQLNPWLKYIDGVSHGYVVIDVTPERVQADYHHTPVPTSAAARPAGRPGRRARRTRAACRRWRAAAGCRRHPGRWGRAATSPPSPIRVSRATNG